MFSMSAGVHMQNGLDPYHVQTQKPEPQRGSQT